MFQFDPTAIGGGIAATIDGYDGPAPALLFEAYRDGVSVGAANGTVGFGDPTPAGTDDKFEIGSQTKMMTATVLLQLVDEGHFSLDDRLADVLDVSSLSWMANIEEATVRQLMTHRSGIPDFVNDQGVNDAVEALLGQDPPHPVGLRKYLELFEAADLPASSEPGTEESYSNTGFLLLGLLIENATGTALADEFQTRIFDPAGMTSSSLPGFERPDGILSSYAVRDGEAIEVTTLPIADMGDGGVVSTTGDMIRFMKALFIDGTLVPETQSEALEQYFTTGDEPDDGVLIGHGGGTFGTTSITLFHPATGTIFSAAETMRYGRDVPSQEVFEVIASVLENPAWDPDYLDGGAVHFAAAAADLEVGEAVGTGGDPETSLTVDGVTLSFDGRLSDFETERLSFEDGSILHVSEATGSDFRVARDARSAADADNRLVGLAGDDHLTGGRGDDRITGGAGDDDLIGRRGHDSISGGAGDDDVAGGRGDDLLSGDDGDDVLAGGRGDDALGGGTGDDVLRGGRGDDGLSGGAGDDVLRGGRGDDTLDGDEGDDILIGGRGADVFVFAGDSGDDVIRGFEAGRDRIDLTALDLTFEDLQISECRGGREVEILLDDASLAITMRHGELAETDFVF